MVEANPVKFYLANSFCLAMSLIQWLGAPVVLIRFQLNSKNFLVGLLFIVLGAVFFSIFVILNSKVKRVAVGKNKIVVIEGDRNLRFEWPEVKSLSLVPIFNV